PYEAVTIVMGDTGLTPDQGKSTASSNVMRGLRPLRAAAAEARLVLLTLASERLKAPVDKLVARDGIVSVAADSSKQVTYGALRAGRRFERRLKRMPITARDLEGVADPRWKAPEWYGWGPLVQGEATLKTKDFKYVGRSMPRRDLPAKATGTRE